MKRFLLLLMLIAVAPLVAPAQNLDTVLVRTGVTMQAQDFALAVSGINPSDDSVTNRMVERISAKLKATPGLGWTTTVSVDSLSGSFLMGVYRRAKTAHAGTIATRYASITSSIAAKAELSAWINEVNAYWDNILANARARGKTLLLD